MVDGEVIGFDGGVSHRWSRHIAYALLSLMEGEGKLGRLKQIRGRRIKRFSIRVYRFMDRGYLQFNGDYHEPAI